MILLCLAPEDDERPARSAAEKLAAGLGARVRSVRVMASGEEAATPEDGWTLRSDEPVRPLLNLVRLQRARHVLLAPGAWERWGAKLYARGRAAGELAVMWSLAAPL